MQNEIVEQNGPPMDLAKLTEALANISGTAPKKTDTAFIRMQKNGAGEWTYGKTEISVHAEDEWAVDPTSFVHGWVLSEETLVGAVKQQKKVHEVLLPMTQKLSPRLEIPEATATQAFACDYQTGFMLRCVKAKKIASVGVSCRYRNSSQGAISAVGALLSSVENRVATVDDQTVVPIITLGAYWYKHTAYGRIWCPEFNVVSWTDMKLLSRQGQPGESEVEEVPVEEPAIVKRRRV